MGGLRHSKLKGLRIAGESGCRSGFLDRHRQMLMVRLAVLFLLSEIPSRPGFCFEGARWELNSGTHKGGCCASFAFFSKFYLWHIFGQVGLCFYMFGTDGAILVGNLS